jgi:hypothetical protein
MPTHLEQYQSELAEVLRAFDKDEILAFFQKHNIPTPSSDEVFWSAVHKMRMALPGMTKEEKAFSKEWLRSYGHGPGPDNLQLHMRIFGAKLLELRAKGKSDEEAGLEAAKEANKHYPLSEEDIQHMRETAQAK